MIIPDFDRTIDPFEWKPGLDASPDFIPDAEYTLDPTVLDKEFEEVLEMVVQTFDDDDS
jgi:hypothetical protein